MLIRDCKLASADSYDKLTPSASVAADKEPPAPLLVSRCSRMMHHIHQKIVMWKGLE